jgi:hypothetical protein
MVSGDCKTITDAAQKVGLARESLSKALSKPHIAEHLRANVLKSLPMAAAPAGATKANCSTAPTKWCATAPRALCWVWRGFSRQQPLR